MSAKTGKERFLSLCGSGIDVFEERSSDEQTAVLDALQRFKDGSKVAPPKSSVLGIRSVVTLPERTDRFSPNKFYQTRKGLYIWNGFTDRILLGIRIVPASLASLTMSYHPLIRTATDAELRGELPEGHVFQNASIFCAYLAGMIESQKNGEEGDLLTDGCANIFYVVGINSEVFAVGVYWHSGDRGWDVLAYQLGDLQWLAGHRVFSATAAA